MTVFFDILSVNSVALSRFTPLRHIFFICEILGLDRCVAKVRVVRNMTTCRLSNFIEDLEKLAASSSRLVLFMI